jgi:hypothetical protein
LLASPTLEVNAIVELSIKSGKALAGATMASFMNKCEGEQGEAMKVCEARALSKDGKPLVGAAKTANIKKFMAGG